MVDKNGTSNPQLDAGLEALLHETHTQALKDLIAQQMRLQELLEEMHAKQIDHAQNTTAVVEEAVRKSFVRFIGTTGLSSESRSEPENRPPNVPDIETAEVDEPELECPKSSNSTMIAQKVNNKVSTCWDEDSEKRNAVQSKESGSELGPRRDSNVTSLNAMHRPSQDATSVKQLWNATKLARKNSMNESQKPKGQASQFLKKLVESNQFDYFVGGVILLNSIFIAYQTDWFARHLQEPTGSTAALFRTCDVIFTLFFSLELGLRVIVERMRFITGRNKAWNFFDSVIVATAIVEASMELTSNTRVLRLLRVMRLVRLARFIRVMRVFRELRAMVWGIMHSIMSLIWAVILLVIIIFLFACYVTQAVAQYLMEDQNSLSVNLTEDDFYVLRNSYGSLMQTMYALYQAITGGQDWSYFADPLFKISSLAGSLFCFYIAFAVFAVLNVVTGVFVDNAMKSTELDTDLMIVEENAARVRHVEGLRAVFHKADVDGSGTIEWDEFCEHLSDPVVQAYFRQLGLDVCGPGVKGLWDLLDFDGNGTLNIDEMVFGAARLKGHASSLDLARESYNARRVQFEQFEAIERMFKEVRQFQNQHTGVLLRDIRKFMSSLGYYGPPQPPAPQPPAPLNASPTPPKTPQGGTEFVKSGEFGTGHPRGSLPPVPDSTNGAG
eukprot:gnl/MRDRNA2_/MRDRNA2_77720_c0_seq2.p1 gnl/MRDRNA2_/MRDRNA2_77720_c0~~gnl/MRDRNA2_/MRDRNA2_77720_c0_seq2.p1  ORF type:complete len:668 (+),score=101.60 gnl/MRDRNA2_/MRDRNA2_77720_c0_seq2:93-2096(+)